MKQAPLVGVSTEQQEEEHTHKVAKPCRDPKGVDSSVVAHELAGKTARPDRMPSTVFSIHLRSGSFALIPCGPIGRG
jgi:hypothetical protein